MVVQGVNPACCYSNFLSSSSVLLTMPVFSERLISSGSDACVGPLVHVDVIKYCERWSKAMYCCSINNLGWNFIIELGVKLLMKLLIACIRQYWEDVCVSKPDLGSNNSFWVFLLPENYFLQCACPAASSGCSSEISMLNNAVQCIHISLFPCEVFLWNWAIYAAAKSKRLICNLNQIVKWDRNSLKGICKHGNWYSVSGTTDFSLWFRPAIYLLSLFTHLWKKMW